MASILNHFDSSFLDTMTTTQSPKGPYLSIWPQKSPPSFTGLALVRWGQSSHTVFAPILPVPLLCSDVRGRRLCTSLNCQLSSGTHPLTTASLDWICRLSVINRTLCWKHRWADHKDNGGFGLLRFLFLYVHGQETSFLIHGNYSYSRFTNFD